MTTIQMPDQIAAHRVRAPAGGVEGGLAHRAADRLAAEQAGGKVAHSLGEEVAVHVGRPPVGVGRGFAYPDSLHQHDDRDGQRVDDQVERNQAQIRQCRKRNRTGNGAPVLDPGNTVGAGDDHGERRDDQRH
jgi:hypothetical protein